MDNLTHVMEAAPTVAIAVPFVRTEHGARVVVTWPKLRNRGEGKHWHLLTGRSSPGAITLHAMPLFVKPSVWGGEEAEVTVAISFSDGA